MRHRKKKLNYNKLVKIKHKRKQHKVHRGQMSQYDLVNLANKVREISSETIRVSWHVIKKNDKRFTLNLFTDALIRNFDSLEQKIIEYNEIPISTNHVKDIDKRVLIRDDYDFDGLNLCFVLSLTRNEIVTAYWIEKDFYHEELNWKRYNPTFYISIC